MTSIHYIAHAREENLLELPEEAKALGIKPGEAVSVRVERDEPVPVGPPNERALAALRQIAEIVKDMPKTDGSQTDRILREGRSGAMYGD